MTLTAQAIRTAQAIALDTTPGLPALPFIPVTWSSADQLSPAQQEANLLHVALWVVESDLHNFDMHQWHAASDRVFTTLRGPLHMYNTCGTIHCIAGFSQVMAGQKGFEITPRDAGVWLLGEEAACHFHDSNEDGLDFLQRVISRNTPST